MHSTVRVEGWDVLRVFAAFDTAALHVTGLHWMGGVGLPLFLILSVALSVSRRHPSNARLFAAKRWRRVVVPWLAWFVMLSGVEVVHALVSGQGPLDWWRWEMTLYGPKIHLWFLPAIFVAGVSVHLVDQRLRTREHQLSPQAVRRFRLSVIGVSLVASSMLLALPAGRKLGWPFEQWLFTLPALPLGWLLGRVRSEATALSQLRSRAFQLALWVAAAAGLCILLSPQSFAVVVRYGAAVALLALVTWLPNRPVPGVKLVTPLLLGTYVLHPAVFSWFVQPWGLSPEGSLVLTSAATLFVVALLRRVPAVREVL